MAREILKNGELIFYLSSSSSMDWISWTITICRISLILAAICANGSYVAGYINQIDNYDANDIALICLFKTHTLYDEA